MLLASAPRDPVTVKDMTIYELWRAVGVIVGFQVVMFGWRIAREQRLSEYEKTPNWFPVADALNVLSFGISVVVVFVLPILRPSHPVSLGWLGVAFVLFAAFPFALIAHYEWFLPKHRSNPHYFPCQEKIVVAVTAVLVAVFSIWYWA